MRSQHMAVQQRRVRQILWGLFFAFGALVLISVGRGSVTNTVLGLFTMGLLGVAYRWNAQNRPERAAMLMVAVLMAMLSVITAFNEGLYDEAPLAFPGLLVFASMFASRRLFMGLLASMLAVVVALYAAHQWGWVLSTPDPLAANRPIIIGIIVLVTGFYVWMLSADLGEALGRLEAEKQALEVSHARIEVMAHRDSLTQLPNRALAQERLQWLLQQAQRGPSQVAVLFLDLDNFKTINDSLGHAAGDELLCQVAARLSTCIRSADTVARFSGDEFLLLVGGLESDDAATTVAGKIMEAMGQSFTLGGLDVVVTASLGVAMAPRDGTEVDALLKNADAAMHRAKAAGRNAFRFFDAGMNDSVLEHLHLASALRQALAQGELQLHYQPQWDLASGRVVGAEALVRWLHPQQGWIAPVKFIPVAERSGLIQPLGAWVLQQACADAQRWRAQGLGDLGVSVNVSPLQFRRGTIEGDVVKALAASGLAPQALELEMTESLLMEDSLPLGEVLQRLSAQGVQIAIDDFGTGYSNLGYLQRFAVHRLKIDQSFVRRMASQPHDEGIVRAIIEMAHCLDLTVVAEGVEDAGMLARLQCFGCEYGQGFHWSPALPGPEFMAFVRRHQGTNAQMLFI